MKLPELKQGEIYIGTIGDAAGNLHHVILLPGDYADSDWQAAMDWAKSIGGDLPNRIEQAMLWANHRDQFKKYVYWSNETPHSESGWAWCQYFNNGLQTSSNRNNELLARAVRRVKGE